jgi:hypothetical protein
MTDHAHPERPRRPWVIAASVTAVIAAAGAVAGAASVGAAGRQVPTRAAAPVVVGHSGLSMAGLSMAAMTMAGMTMAGGDDVSDVAGFTRIATTPSYVVVVNVLPGETMYDAGAMAATHPVEGELALDGVSNPVGTGVRHVEAHVYDRTTGLPLSDLHPTIQLVNRTTGERVDVPPTLMQDIVIGHLDVHYGNNVPVTGNSDLELTVRIGDEGVIVSGRLD